MIPFPNTNTEDNWLIRMFNYNPATQSWSQSDELFCGPSANLTTFYFSNNNETLIVPVTNESSSDQFQRALLRFQKSNTNNWNNNLMIKIGVSADFTLASSFMSLDNNIFMGVIRTDYGNELIIKQFE